MSRVVPLHKKGDPNNLTNYRPISIVPIMGKIIEKILFEQLYEYSETKYILSPFQFGFRQGRCTTSAIQELVSRVISGFENSKYVGGTFCDLSKAFDCVSPRILIEKLKFYGISGTSLDLINSYLSDRTQATQYKQNISSVVKLKYGVPQGSVLGPLLFLYFINDLPKYINDGSILFADDTTLIDSSLNSTNLHQIMRETELKALNWFEANKLNLNNEKTTKIVFSTSSSYETQETKFLGVVLDSHLTWDAHVEYISGKLNKAIYLLRQLKDEVSSQMLLIAYYSLFQSVASYAITVWGHSPHAKRIFALQRRALRVVFGLGYQECVKNIFINKRILTVPSLFILYSLIYIKDNLNKYKLRINMHTRSLRNNDDLHIEYLRLEKSKTASNYYGPVFYNSLSNEITALPRNKFITQIKTLLTEGAYYDYRSFYVRCCAK
jgi:hypothetical protein